MPFYKTHCEACKAETEIKLSFSDYDAVKIGTKLLECSSCQGKVVIDFDPGNVGFIFNDGESGGWQSKAIKENKYRKDHWGVMGRKKKDHVFQQKLIPNFDGKETSSWREAKADAVKELGPSAAKSYDPLIKAAT